MENGIHEDCGIVLIRLRKPLDYYRQKYGSWTYGLDKLYLMMEKQHNRGQEGAGIACVKIDAAPGTEYIFRERAAGTNAITDLMETIHNEFKDIPADDFESEGYAKEFLPFAGEVYMGHLRYSTTGKSGQVYLHPFLRRSNWCAKSLALCGNFNLTNVDTIFDSLTAIGQHPRQFSDTHILLEQIGHRLDMEVEYLYRQCKAEGFEGQDITKEIDNRFDMSKLLRKCTPLWDGGYVMEGITGSGESFVVRDPWGIRPAYYYCDDEIVVAASERPVIQTVMNVHISKVHELERGEALMVNKRGEVRVERILPAQKNSACSFERVYFSRGSDKDIYQERKNLGRNLVEPILKEVGYDIDHTVFSFIPNTAESAYFGMLEGFNDYLNAEKAKQILAIGPNPSEEAVMKILSRRIRSEKVAIKDIKLRTFIAEGKSRNDLAAHVYDVTYGIIENHVDNLVVIDDSIVRGTTLRQSIIKILDRLVPKKIVIVSSCPQVRYPDCYGIDMSTMSQFIAFKAAVALLEERGMQDVISSTYKAVKEQQNVNPADPEDCVKRIYAPFSDEEISGKIAEMLKEKTTNAEIGIVYQTLEGLHKAIPDHPGDWYFSGDYPTKGGTIWVNRAFADFYEKEYSEKGLHII
jgi:amidophosphoribosyltransferase